jgi:hypothetical protein
MGDDEVVDTYTYKHTHYTNTPAFISLALKVIGLFTSNTLLKKTSAQISEKRHLQSHYSFIMPICGIWVSLANF